MIQMAFCDLSHTFHKQVTNVSQHVFVILLWGILISPHNNVSAWTSPSGYYVGKPAHNFNGNTFIQNYHMIHSVG